MNKEKRVMNNEKKKNGANSFSSFLLTNGAKSRSCLHGHDRASEETKGIIPCSLAAENRRRRWVQGLPCGMILFI
jgi:hypothetical protein